RPLPRAHDARPDDARARRRQRAGRRRWCGRRPDDCVHLDPHRHAGCNRRHPGRARADDLRPELRLHPPAPDLCRGRARRHRQRLRRARRRAHAGARDGTVDLAFALRRRQPGLQAGCRVRRARRRVDGAPPGVVRPREGGMSALASGEFWAFVGVAAGIYTILALGLQLQFGFAGLLNFGQVAFMAIGAYTMAILVVKEGWRMWLAAPLGIAAAAAGGIVLGLPSLRLRADYFAIVTIAFSEIVRYV